GLVLACCLPERHGIGFLVEDIVYHLKRETHAFGIPVEAIELGLRERGAATRPQEDGCADERARLEDVHELELGEGEALADGLEIDRLAARHAARAARRGEELDHLELRLGIGREAVFGEDLEGEALQRIAREE